MEFRKSSTFTIAAVAFLTSLPLGLARGAETAPTIPHPSRFDIETIEADVLLDAAESGEAVSLVIRGIEYRIRLQETVVRSERFRARRLGVDGARKVIPPRSRTFRGKVVDDPDSMVRLTVTRSGVVAYLRTADGTFFVEPLAVGTAAETARTKSENPHAHRVFADEDLEGSIHPADEPDGDMVRVEDDLPPVEPIGDPTPVFEQANVEGAELRVMEVAIEVDYAYWNLFGEETTEQIEALFNTVSGIYEEDLGVTIEISSLLIHEDQTDDYSSHTALDLLYEMRERWNTIHGSVPRDVVHMITGKNLDGTTVGIAFVGEVCDLGTAYALSQHIYSTSLMPLLVAHEIGHNLGAHHDPTCDCDNYIMQPVLSHSTIARFSQMSQTDIQAYISGHGGCLSLLTEGDGSGGDVSSPIEQAPVSGGGPVDPVVALGAAALWLAARRRSRRRSIEG